MYHSILVGQDSSTHSKHALDLAIWIARSTHARLTLIHVHGRKLPLQEPEPEKDMHRLLAQRGKLVKQARLPCETKIVSGWTTQAFLDETMWYDLAVVGKHGNSQHRHASATGTLATALLANSPVPTLVVDDTAAIPKRLLVVFDGTTDACRALRVAAALADERRLGLHVVEVVRRARPDDSLGRVRNYLSTYHRVKANVSQLVGSFNNALPRYIRDNDVQLTFLPALAGSFFGRKLTTVLAVETSSSILVPEGRIPPVY